MLNVTRTTIDVPTCMKFDFEREWEDALKNYFRALLVSNQEPWYLSSNLLGRGTRFSLNNSLFLTNYTVRLLRLILIVLCICSYFIFSDTIYDGLYGGSATRKVPTVAK